VLDRKEASGEKTDKQSPYASFAGLVFDRKEASEEKTDKPESRQKKNKKIRGSKNKY